MILPTMTLTELAKEIQSDYKEVHARWTKFNPKFNKMRLKLLTAKGTTSAK